MSSWQEFSITGGRDFGNSVLFNMPKKSKWRGWSFFMPAKLCHEWRNGGGYNVAICPEFEVRLSRKNGDDYDRDTIDGAELLDLFGGGLEESKDTPPVVVEEPELRSVELPTVPKELKL